MSGKFSLEVVREVWDDGDGTVIEIGPDRDGLGLVELRERGRNHEIVTRMTFQKEQAKLIARALLDAVGGDE